MKNHFFKTRCAAIILIAAGYGWSDGHYIPSNSSIEAYIFQFIIIAALLIMGTGSLSTSENEKHKNNWSVTGLSIFLVFLLLINILNIVHGSNNSNVNTFGSRNSFANLAPVALLIAGNVLWVISIFQSLRHGNQDGYLPESEYNIL